VILKGGGVDSKLLNAPLAFGFRNNSSSLGMLRVRLGASRAVSWFQLGYVGVRRSSDLRPAWGK
jgi:hypothetical protein